mmetsp:Transcript_29864/g.70203  ORF Transcript_29864/g.70203 Transcript_29864/m.70203 type:complete len:177 (+) Transcript_29864:100-630(+)
MVDVRLSKEEIARCTDEFNLFKNDADKGIPTPSLGSLMSSLGYVHREEEIEEMKGIGDSGGQITLNSFLFLVEMCPGCSAEALEVERRQRILELELYRALLRHATDGLVSNQACAAALLEVAVILGDDEQERNEMLEEVVGEMAVEEVFDMFFMKPPPEDPGDCLTKSALMRSPSS